MGPGVTQNVHAACPILPARVVQYAPREQAIVLMGFPGVNVKDPRWDALMVLDKVMSGLSSDLAMEIREKRGLVYFSGAYNFVGVEPGAFVFYAGTRPEKTDEVEQEIMKEIARVCERGIRAEELDRARNQMIHEHEMGLQDNAGLALTCALDELYGLGFDYSLGIKERLNLLTLDSVRDAAKSVLSANAEAVSIVLPIGGESAAPGTREEKE